MIKLNKESFKLPNNTIWETYEIIIDTNSNLFKNAQNQAETKSQFTMNAGQDGRNRSNFIKYQMQLMGILAEIGCQYYLKNIIETNAFMDWDVIRYDDVRKDGFKSPENEFDIRIVNKIQNIIINVESRSSITYDRTFEAGLSQYDIIGYYSSIAKSKEGLNDIYLRPLYRSMSIPLNDYKTNFENYFLKGLIKLYIVAGCTVKSMQDNGYNKSMGQGKSLYRCVKIVDAVDIIAFEKTIKEKITNETTI